MPAPEPFFISEYPLGHTSAPADTPSVGKRYKAVPSLALAARICVDAYPHCRKRALDRIVEHYLN